MSKLSTRLLRFLLIFYTVSRVLYYYIASFGEMQALFENFFDWRIDRLFSRWYTDFWKCKAFANRLLGLFLFFLCFLKFLIFPFDALRPRRAPTFWPAESRQRLAKEGCAPFGIPPLRSR